MIALLQRVSSAQVVVDGGVIADITQGVLAFIGVEHSDSEQQADRLLERILGYRLFSDDQGRMNLSVRDVGGSLLLVPQFTLAADTDKGMRPSFTPAASPMEGERLFSYLIQQARQGFGTIATGQFGADMQVSLINDGPVTFWLKVNPE